MKYGRDAESRVLNQPLLERIGKRCPFAWAFTLSLARDLAED